MKSTKQGYVQVSPFKMLSALLSDKYNIKLRAVQIGELHRIDARSKKYSTVSENERQYMESLYIDVVLNDKSYQTPSKKKIIGDGFISLVKEPQHIGMIKYQQFLTN